MSFSTHFVLNEARINVVTQLNLLESAGLPTTPEITTIPITTLESTTVPQSSGMMTTLNEPVITTAMSIVTG
jgi:hypothetical protein